MKIINVIPAILLLLSACHSAPPADPEYYYQLVDKKSGEVVKTYPYNFDHPYEDSSACIFDAMNDHSTQCQNGSKNYQLVEICEPGTGKGSGGHSGCNMTVVRPMDRPVVGMTAPAFTKQ